MIYNIIIQMQKPKIISFSLLCLTVSIISIFTILTFFEFANAQNNTLIEQQVIGNMSSKATNIVLIHGFWGDGSSWSKVIPILKNAGHKVIAVQLPLHSLADDIATTKRAVDQLGGPTILVGHSYGGFVLTNVGYNNPNVTGLVYVAGWAPEEGKSLNDYVAKFPKDFLRTYDNIKPDNSGFLYISQDKFRESFAQDVDATEADVMAVVQKPPHQSISAEKSGPPAWKQIPSWYQVSENDRMIYPDLERQFAKQINATTISLPASHASLVSHPNEIAELILNVAKESSR
jgi:pimeloyl-ACP methyl ester carboxylesterase